MTGTEGKFIKHFTGKGTYHYSTGYMDSATIFASGSLRVVDAVDKPYKLSVMVNGQEAVHNGNSNNNQPSNTCEFFGSSTANKPTENGFFVTYSWGATTVLRSVTYANPNINDMVGNSPESVVSVHLNGGNNYNPQACPGKVMVSFDEFECVNESATSTKQVCKINPDGQMDTQVARSPKVAIKNAGLAYFYDYSYDTDTSEYQIGSHLEVDFAPYVTSFSPGEFSRYGDVMISLDGNGFLSESGDIMVEFKTETDDVFPCKIEEISYTAISCRLSRIGTAHKDADSNLSGFLRYGDKAYPIKSNPFRTRNSFTPNVSSILPMEVSAAGETMTIKGSRLDELVVSVGGKNCEIISATANQVTCTVPDLAAGRFDVELSALYGGVRFTPTKITSNLNAVSINPATAGVNGGQLISVAGFGFDRDTVIETRTSDGELICEFCHIFDIPTASELIFYSPRVLEAGAFKVKVKHEYLQTSIAAMDLTISDTLATVSGSSLSSNSVSTVKGGETLNIQGSDFGSCDDLQVEIVRALDPCASGMHECHGTLGKCTPTADGLDYTCSCKEFDEFEEFECNSDCQLYREDRNGRECSRIIRRGLALEADAESMCEGEHGERIWEIDSPYLENLFKETIIGLEGSSGTSSRGTYVKWYGELKCLRGVVNEDTGVFELEFPEGGCDTWGNTSDQFKKRVWCKRYAYRNCFDHSLGDRGRYTYNGRKTTTITGKQCQSWETTSWFTEDGYGNEQYGNHENVCSNLWQGSDGIKCFLGTTGVWTQGEVRESCGIPKCADLWAGKGMQECTIQAVEKRDGQYRYTFEGDTWTDDMPCYFQESSHTEKALHNSFGCRYRNRFPDGMSFVEVDGSPGEYKIVRNRYDDDVAWHLAMDVTGRADRPIYMTKDESIINSAATNFVLDKDTFIKGTYTIRQGDYFVVDPVDPHYAFAAKQSEFTDKEVTYGEVSFKVSCASDDFGALIEQPAKQFKTMAVLAPTCGADLSVTLPSLEAGDYKAVVRSAAYGQAVNVVDLTYAFSYSEISPLSVGVGGGAEITFRGTGFSENVKMTLCQEDLPFVSYTAASDEGAMEEVKFLTVPFDPANCGDGIVLTTTNPVTGETITASDTGRRRRAGGFTVDASLTPQLTMVEPKKGGTMGGTTLTITGSGFGSTIGDVSVTLFDVACDVKTVIDTEITCVTNAFPRDRAQEPVAPVVFIDNGPGTAISGAAKESDIEFWYVDRWSSPYTWGCTDDSCKPKAGEIIVIPAGQVILLDETTPILAVLIIDGGKFIWDRKDGIELHMQYGVVNSGGHFQIGTEDEPFCEGNALIQLYGHQRSINLPIYGAKVLAIRFGTLDIHGCPKTTTWTELETTVEAGAEEITLTHPVKDDWFVGNEIIIAATGDLTNFHRSEKREIVSVSDDGYTVKLNKALEHRHMAVCTNGPNNNGAGWGWKGEICTRAEVGLLTRNVKLRGNVNNQWTEELPECKLGPGTAFGTQTCFQNRYGHETGSDQFGGILFIHKPHYAKIEFFEVTHAGQAFNLARYPIHFHTPGSLPDSYVRGCGIHNTFNRALTLHGVHDLLVEFNVIYNVMGLAFFMEDAVEENNILRYNLGIMNKKSSSLLNVDSTPSVFWITNPNNIFYGNRAAASSHFGFWFNPPEDGPTGPSAKDPQYDWVAPKHRPLGQFYNNTAHSLGKYGMWVFVDLTPTGPNGLAGETTPRAMKIGALPESGVDIEGNPVPADTFGFFAWHCERGAEIATGGALQFHNMIAANNWIAGLAGKETFLKTFAVDGMEDQTQLFKRNIVIGHLGGDWELDACGDMGIETPWKFFAFTVEDIDFYNFDSPTPDKASVNPSEFGMSSELAPRRCVAIDPCYGSNALDCGAVTWYSKVRWHNSPRRTCFAWEHEAAFYDRDGTFAGKKGRYVVAESATYNPNLCKKDNSGKWDIASTDPDDDETKSHGAMVCDEEKNGERFKPHRFMFNQGKPDSVEGTMARFENQYGVTRSPFRNCRPRGKGWMVMLNTETEYSMVFENHEHISNISFAGDIDNFEQDEWLTIRHDFPEHIDYAQLNKEDGTKINGSWPSDPLTLNAYDYQVLNDTAPFSVRYTFNGKAAEENPQISPEEGALTYGMDFFLQPNFYKCFYPACEEPEPEPPSPPPALVDCNFKDCFGGQMPADWENIVVQASQKMIVDADSVAAAGNHLKFGSVVVDGTLSIPADAIPAGKTLTIEADSMIVNTGEPDVINGSRRRRDLMYINNGAIVIGTADNPIPCDRKVIIKINGDKNSPSVGALPGSIPIGAKALGGIGGLQFHGCKIENTWTFLTNTVQSGANKITVDGDISEWNVADEIAVATSDYEQRHTEYFAITGINGQEISLNTSFAWTHTGSADTASTKLTRSVHQGAEVALLTRNILIDGSGGAESKVGGRVLITGYTKTVGLHDYVRKGYGQFSYVEFKGMGQFGYTNYDDLRAQILFYDVNVAGDANNGILPSYVKGCAFHGGFHTAVAAMFNSDGLEVSDNIIFGAAGSAIRTDSAGLIIKNNIIGNIFQSQLWGEYMDNALNTNFADDKMPAGIDTSETQDVAEISGNRVSGVEGSCFAGHAETCDASEACKADSIEPNNKWTDNKGSSCMRGYYMLWTGHTGCSKIQGFYFYKMWAYGITVQTKSTLIIDNTIIEDSVVGVYGIITGPNAVSHLFEKKSVTIKNSYISAKGDHYDCDYDAQWQNGNYAAKFVGRQLPAIGANKHTGIVMTDFMSEKTGFPACAWPDLAANTAMYGKTCVINTELANFNDKCGDKDLLVRPNKGTLDHAFPVHFLSGNTKTNVGAENNIEYYRPDLKKVNIADCVDLFCDGAGRAMIIDESGDIFGEAGTMLPESEYEWDGLTRVQPDGQSVTYSQTQDGLGDYRIPAPMKTRIDGSKIPMNEVFSDGGIARGNDCVWKSHVPGWWCPSANNALRYFDLLFESLDLDHERRRLTPLAVRSDGFVDIINGPGDHSCCIGYACFVRLSQFHSTVACGKTVDW